MARANALSLPVHSLALLAQQAQTTGKAAPIARPATAMGLLDWQFKYRKFLKPGLEFDVSQHEYLIEIYRDDAPRVVSMKAGQMGLSEWAVSQAAYYADQMGYNVLYVMPTDGDKNDFSSMRFSPAIDARASPYLASRIVPAGGKRRGVDQVGIKRLGDGNIIFVGATVRRVDGKDRATQLHSKPADVLFLDEYDLINEVAISKAEQRLGHSKVKIIRMLSTPTYSGTGIHLEYLASDRRRWFIKCAACGEWNLPCNYDGDLREQLSMLILEWDNLERPSRWNVDDNGKPCLRCAKCDAVLDRSGKGEWVAELPGREVHGYHVVGVSSPFKNLMDIIGTRNTEKLTGLQNPDESKRQEIINQGVGVPYRPAYSVNLSDETLDACRRDYRLGPQANPRLVAFCGIDVGRVLHVIIRGADWRLLAAVQCNWGDIRALLRTYNVACTVIDGEPETTKARELQRLFPERDFWVSDYVPSDVRNPSPYAWDLANLRVVMDRTRTLDSLFSLFRLAAAGDDRGATLPITAREIQDYYSHMKALERKIAKNAKGDDVAVYEHSRADHFAHAENYCLAANVWHHNPANARRVVKYEGINLA